MTLSSETAIEETPYPFPVTRIRRGRSRLLRRLRTIVAIRQLARQADAIIVAGLPFEASVAVAGVRRPALVMKLVGDLVWERAHLQGRTREQLEVFQGSAGPGRDRLLHSLQSLVARRADAVVVPSRHLGRLVERWGIERRKLFVIPNAYCGNVFPSVEETSKTIDLITVSRLIPLKRIDGLIRMAARRGWTLEIVGDGPERGNLERLALHVQARGVRFSGAISRDGVVAAIARARVFVLNSEYETFPHVILEAMAAGVPVVARSVGGIGEIVTSGIEGVLAPWDDDDAFEEAVSRLLSDRVARQRAGEAGRARVDRDFSMSRMVDRTERVLAWARDRAGKA